MTDQPVLALDFDGVIADSLAECLVVSWNAWQRLQGKSGHIQAPEEIEPEYEALFRRLRPFIRTGEDYILIHMSADAGAAVRNQNDFDRFAAPHTEDRPRLREAFYASRTSLFAEHREQWLQFNPLYRGMEEFLRRWPDPDRLLIISTKRSDFIAAIFEGYRIAFPDRNIYYASPKRSKPSIIVQLLEALHLPPRLFHFVDDQADTLLKVLPTGVRCLLAGWGYTNREQIRTAGRAGIEIADREEFLRTWLPH